MDGHHHRLRGTLTALLLAGLLTAGPATAASFPREVLGAAELAALRGGLEVAGLRMDLTARLRTYVDERLAAATEMRITRLAEGKAVMTRRLIEAGLQSASPAPASSGAPAVTITTEQTGEGFATSLHAPPATAAASPAAAATAPPAVGTVPVTPGQTVAGQTRVDHVISPRQVLSTITNTANHRSVQQSVELELTVHNFRAFAAHARDVIRARALGRALAR